MGNLDTQDRKKIKKRIPETDKQFGQHGLEKRNFLPCQAKGYFRDYFDP
jgi:hypothetical protein